MNDTRIELRREIVAVSRALDGAGLMPNKSGNVSCRVPGGFLITPSGVPYSQLEAAQVVELTADGVAGGGRTASVVGVAHARRDLRAASRSRGHRAYAQPARHGALVRTARHPGRFIT